MPLAEFNFGTLKFPWDDPRLADFQDNVDRVNAIAQRSPGFIWMFDEVAMEAAQHDPAGPFPDGNLVASTLSIWEDAASLWQFVHTTVHARFLARGAEWFVDGDRSHLVVWEVPKGHRPGIAEAMDEWRALQAEGDTISRFGGTGLKTRAEARL